MKLLQGLAVASSLLAPACVTEDARANDHWSSYSIGPSMSRALVGYDHERDGPSYLDFQWERKQDVNRTLRRHFLNDNPDNPFKPRASYEVAPRPQNSPLPEPHRYFHWTLIDGPIATFADRDGIGEFWQGTADAFEPLSVVISSLLYDAASLPRADE